MDKKGNFFTKAYGHVGKGWIINRSICCFVIIALIVAVIVGTNVAYSWQLQISAYLCPPITDDKATSVTQAKSKELSKQIELEGATLLKNADNVLPLSKTEDKKVNVFGFGSVDWSYGALGAPTSGRVMPETGNANDLVDFLKSLTRYGVSYNTALPEFYKNFCHPLNGIMPDATGNAVTLYVSEILKLREPPMNVYPKTLLEQAEEYSDVAIVVISRSAYENTDATNFQWKGGPGQTTDNDRHYLEISTEEEELLKYVGSHYEKTIVLINSGSLMECSFMETIPGLDACVYVGFTGTVGATSIPKLLYGGTSFSGKLVDSLPYSFDYSPASWGKWFGSYAYEHKTEEQEEGNDYIEGIYVGYKWYETASHEGVYDSVDNTSLYGANAKGYYGIMQYPFGFGLTYTDFEWTVKSVKSFDSEKELTDNKINENTTFEIVVNVKNIGEVAGKDVVEAYVTVPYTKGGIEKSYVSLVGYAKTETIAPGSEQEVTVKIDAYDFISYDCYDKNNNGFKGYELEAGDYQIKLQTDSHNIKEAILPGKTAAEAAIFTFNVAETIKLATDKYTGAEVKNLFTGDDAIDGFSLDGIESDYNANIPWMTRADFKDGYQIPERTDAVKYRALSNGAKNVYYYSEEKAAAWDNATVDEFGNAVDQTKPTWGAKNGVTVYEEPKATEYGLELGNPENYDNDELWNKVLDQITYQEAVTVIGPANSGNAKIDSIGKPRLFCYDSIIQVRGFATTPRGTGNTSTTILAMCWNEKLAYDYATSFANEMSSLGVHGIFGPGANLHRSPFGGRNYEYFSEDTFITTKMACTIVRGLQNYGHGVEMKHFALNEQETGREYCATWLSEQTLRETYLKPFQVAVETENLSGMMSSYNRIGAKWTGGSVALLTGVLRKEWGFKGYVDTDWAEGRKSSIDEQLRSGGDLGMAKALGTFYLIDYSQSATSGRLQQNMRLAVKHLLYGWLTTKYQQSVYVPSADETVTTSFSIEPWQWWQPALTALNVAVYLGCAIWLVALFMPTGKAQDEYAGAYEVGETNEKEGN